MSSWKWWAEKWKNLRMRRNWERHFRSLPKHLHFLIKFVFFFFSKGFRQGQRWIHFAVRTSLCHAKFGRRTFGKRSDGNDPRGGSGWGRKGQLHRCEEILSKIKDWCVNYKKNCSFPSEFVYMMRQKVWLTVLDRNNGSQINNQNRKHQIPILLYVIYLYTSPSLLKCFMISFNCSFFYINE